MNGGFKIRQITAKEHGVKYRTNLVCGYLNGQRIRKKFRSREDALGELNRLQVAAANSDGDVRPVNTRLTPEQVAQAEAAFQRLAGTPLPHAVEWYLANYRPPLDSVPVETAISEFMRDREGRVSMPVVVDYRKVTNLLLKAFPGRKLNAIATADLERVMGTWGRSNKSWNNLRTYLHAFFEFCVHPYLGDVQKSVTAGRVEERKFLEYLERLLASVAGAKGRKVLGELRIDPRRLFTGLGDNRLPKLQSFLEKRLPRRLPPPAK